MQPPHEEPLNGIDPAPLSPATVQTESADAVPAAWMTHEEWERRERRRRRVAAVLFVLTVISTFVTGMVPGRMLGWLELLLSAYLMPIARNGPVNIPWGEFLWSGAVYSGSLMAILAAHEAGHWLQARRHRVPATVPFFVPFPINPFGTMGAVIFQDGRQADRAALFDIAISGPLAGLVLAIPITWLGVREATLIPAEKMAAGLAYGNPLLLDWMIEWVHGPQAAGTDIVLTPLLFAGWVGIFITALNLIPIGQLDGGHILYALILHRARTIALLLMAAGIGMMIYTQSPSYLLMMVLIYLTGARHPPTANDSVPLGPVRIVLGWLTLAFIVVGFTPTPIVELGPPKKEQPAEERVEPAPRGPMAEQSTGTVEQPDG